MMKRTGISIALMAGLMVGLVAAPSTRAQDASTPISGGSAAASSAPGAMGASTHSTPITSISGVNAGTNSAAISSAVAQFQAMTPDQVQAIPPDDIRKIPTDVLRQYATPDNLAKLSPAQQAMVRSVLGGGTQQNQQPQQNQQQDQQNQGKQGASQACPPGEACQNKGDQQSSGSRRFGSELFSNPPSTFAPVADIPVPVNYIVGPGDTVAVQLFGNQNNQFDLIVQRDGFIQFPSLGPIQVAGLTFDVMRQQLLSRISKQMIGTEASITLGALRSIQIFVVGDVRHPGAYTVSSLSKMLNALFVSGGIADTGSYRRIQLKRNGQPAAVLDLYDLLLKGDSSRDAQLRPGDVIFVPPVGKSVTVAGGVLRPAIYELKGGEKVSDVLDYAGGPAPNAFLSLTKIERIAADDRHVVLDANPTSGIGNLSLQDGDVVTVNTSLERLDRMVTVRGYVNREQPVQWRSGLHISDVVASADALKPLADLNFALLVRAVGRDQHLVVYQFKPQDVFQHPHGPQDWVLAPKDELRFFGFDGNRAGQLSDLIALLRLSGRADELANPIVTISGAVQEPGEYPLTEGMTLSDAVRSAISVNKTAWLDAGLVVRRDLRANTVKVFEVSLRPESADLSQFKMAPGDNLLVFAVADDRQALLADVINRIQQQARPNEPARLVKITGEVKFPGDYPLTEDADVGKLVALAGGYTEPAYPYSYEVTRQTIDDQGRFSIRTIDLGNQAIDGGKGLSPGEQQSANDFALQSRDTVVVRRQPGYQEAESIELRGEVRFPGLYRARRGETLSEIIKRAGGLTRFADPSAAIFTRQDLKEAEDQRLQEIQADMEREIARMAVAKANGNGNSNDSGSNSTAQQALLASLSDKLAKLHGVGRLVIDLPRVMKADPDADVEVHDGDVLVVPAKRQEVLVLGEVNYPTSHRVRPGDSARDYINRSGGFTQAADGGRVYIIRANGEVTANAVGWFTSRNIRPGDTIVVPLDLDPVRPLPLFTSIAQIAGQLAITAASLKVIGAF
ncbi:MAG: hypothetical protein E6R07_09310 [Nevskiaceae bacterium]|nr:MAG: hypothetical protein E6R07_09310 [Nevskiaceae bacterium]